jgi:DNA-binding XRE family transcriptional regulator
MMRAYSVLYLNSASAILADMADYAVNDRKLDGDIFMHMFVVSGAARQFAKGNPRYITGRSGIDIADEIIGTTINDNTVSTFTPTESKTPEYWAGWALAQYQWFTAKSFSAIFRYLPFSRIVQLYPALHEADITKFYNIAHTYVPAQTNLKCFRSAAGMTQEKLASESGVALRSIQMYEQRNKDINKAQAIALAKMARVLGCDIEDLLE